MSQPPLPPYKEPFLDQDGVMSRAWRTYFEAMDRYVADLEQRIAALEP